LLDFRHAPIATEFCVASEFRDVPIGDIAAAIQSNEKAAPKAALKFKPDDRRSGGN
jgi:hypothetical protein